jgi:hypothetical protein
MNPFSEDDSAEFRIIFFWSRVRVGACSRSWLNRLYQWIRVHCLVQFVPNKIAFWSSKRPESRRLAHEMSKNSRVYHILATGQPSPRPKATHALLLSRLCQNMSWSRGGRRSQGLTKHEVMVRIFYVDYYFLNCILDALRNLVQIYVGMYIFRFGDLLGTTIPT